MPIHSHDHDHEVRLHSTIGRGPAGHSVSVSVVEGDPADTYRLQFKDSVTGDVLQTTPNMDPGARIHSYDDVMLDVDDSPYTISLSVLDATGDVRVGDYVLYKGVGSTDIQFMCVGLVSSVTSANVTFGEYFKVSGSVGDLADFSVTTTKLADRSVTSEKIGLNAVTWDNLGSSAKTVVRKITRNVDGESRQFGEIVGNGGNVTLEVAPVDPSTGLVPIFNIPPVGTNRIVDGAVTYDKLNADAKTSISKWSLYDSVRGSRDYYTIYAPGNVVDFAPVDSQGLIQTNNLPMESRNPVQTFDTVAAMQAATWLKAGMTCHTNGFHASGDGGAAYYTVSASGTANGMDVLALQGGLFATLVVTEPYVTPEQFGAYGDGTHDDTAALNYAFSNYGVISGVRGASYLISETVYISTENGFDGNGCEFCTSANFAAESRTKQPSLIAVFVQGNGQVADNRKISDFTIRESEAVAGLIGMYVGAAVAYDSQASTNGIAVMSRKFENVVINGFATGLYITEAWDCSFDNVMVSGSRTACCEIKGQSVNNRFDQCGFYGARVSQYALRFDFNDYYSLRSEGNTFSGCFIGEAVTGIFVRHTLAYSFVGCIIDLNSGHAIHDAGGAEMVYTNCYIYSTLVDASIVNGGTVYLAGLAAPDATVKSSFIGCSILNSSNGSNSVIMLANRFSDSFINCYINKPFRAIQSPTKTIIIGCTFAGSGNDAIYGYSPSKHVAFGNVNAVDGAKLFDNGFSDFVIKHGTATATSGTGGEISLHHEGGLTFYVLIPSVTSNVAYHLSAANNGANYSYLMLYNTSGSAVPNTEVTFNYVIIGM